MSSINTIDSLGTRIVSAARMAVAIHLQMPDRAEQFSIRPLSRTAMVGGTDRRVTDDIEDRMNDEG